VRNGDFFYPLRPIRPPNNAAAAAGGLCHTSMTDSSSTSTTVTGRPTAIPCLRLRYLVALLLKHVGKAYRASGVLQARSPTSVYRNTPPACAHSESTVGRWCSVAAAAAAAAAGLSHFADRVIRFILHKHNTDWSTHCCPLTALLLVC
jgi:hypothetical protein